MDHIVAHTTRGVAIIYDLVRLNELSIENQNRRIESLGEDITILNEWIENLDRICGIYKEKHKLVEKQISERTAHVEALKQRVAEAKLAQEKNDEHAELPIKTVKKD